MIINGVLACIVAWLVVLTFFIYRVRKHYRSLTIRTRRQSIDEILEILLKESKGYEKIIKTIQEDIVKLKKDSDTHLQKIGFVRFSPFDKVGVDQSVVIALLDNKKNGMVTTYMYTHDGVRIYSKIVKEGKGVQYELSREEHDAVLKAV